MADNNKIIMINLISSDYVKDMCKKAKDMMKGQSTITAKYAAKCIFDNYHIKVSDEEIEKWSGYDLDDNINERELGAILAGLDGKRRTDGALGKIDKNESRGNFEFDGHIPDKNELGNKSPDSILEEYSNPERYNLLREFGAIDPFVESPEDSNKTNDNKKTDDATPKPTPTPNNSENLLKKTEEEFKIKPFTALNPSSQNRINLEGNNNTSEIPDSYVKKMLERAEKLMGSKKTISIKDVHKILVEEGNISEDIFEVLKDLFRDPLTDKYPDEFTKYQFAASLALLDGQLDSKGNFAFDGHIPDKTEKNGNLENSLLLLNKKGANISRALLLYKFGLKDAAQGAFFDV